METTVPESTLVQSPFLSLPDELLLEVLRHCLIFNKPITALVHSVHKTRLIQIASINKQLYELAMDVYWKENKFAAGVSRTTTPDFSANKRTYSFWYPSSQVASMVRVLTVDLKFSPDDSTYNFRGLCDIFQPGGDWIYIVPNRCESASNSFERYLPGTDSCRRDAYPTSDPVRWQQYFHLQELKIIITLEEKGQDQTCFMGQRLRHRWHGLSLEQCRKDAEERLASISINVDAKKIVCEVRGMKCSGSHGSTMCGGACARIIQQTLQGMVGK